MSHRIVWTPFYDLLRVCTLVQVADNVVDRGLWLMIVFLEPHISISPTASKLVWCVSREIHEAVRPSVPSVSEGQFVAHFSPHGPCLSGLNCSVLDVYRWISFLFWCEEYTARQFCLIHLFLIYIYCFSCGREKMVKTLSRCDSHRYYLVVCLSTATKTSSGQSTYTCSPCLTLVTTQNTTLMIMFCLCITQWLSSLCFLLHFCSANNQSLSKSGMCSHVVTVC